jgi:cyclase
LNKFSLIVVLLLITACVVTSAHAQQRPPSTNDLNIVQVRPNVYLITGGGGNIVVHLGWMGAIIVDTGSAGMTEKVQAAIKKITDKPIRFILNTAADPDHVGGNEALAKAGRSMIGLNAFGGGASFQTNAGQATVMAHENVLNRMSAPTGQTPPYPSTAWPTETFTGGRIKSLYLNGDPIQIFHAPAAHSDGDAIVLFRRADVLVAGDVLDLRHFPAIETESGGSINGEIAALNRLIDLSVPPAPLVWHEDRTLIIPGHGRVCDQADLVEYRDMVTIIRDVIQDMIKQGMTLEQIKAANPTKGYRKQYGSDTGPWTTDMFVTAVYKSLTAKP